MNTASNKLPPSLDRAAGAGKPVDPATRLSELLAQSLEELTRPFDPPKPAPVPLRPELARPEPAVEEPKPQLASAEPRIDADKALAELEAELFAAAQQVSRDLPDAPEPANEDIEGHAEADEHAAEHVEEAVEEHAEDVNHEEPHEEHAVVDDRHDEEPSPAEHIDEEKDEPVAVYEEPPMRFEPAPAAPAVVASPFLAPEPEIRADERTEADASAVIAKVRKLMLVSMAVTIVAVGSVFGFIGYRMMKGEGAAAAKTADKLPEASTVPTDITLTLPHGARVIQSAVSADRLVMTLEIDGKIEVRTFDVNTLQPAGRLNFSGTP